MGPSADLATIDCPRTSATDHADGFHNLAVVRADLVGLKTPERVFGPGGGRHSSSTCRSSTCRSSRDEIWQLHLSLRSKTRSEARAAAVHPGAARRPSWLPELFVCGFLTLVLSGSTAGIYEHCWLLPKLRPQTFFFRAATQRVAYITLLVCSRLTSISPPSSESRLPPPITMPAPVSSAGPTAFKARPVLGHV